MRAAIRNSDCEFPMRRITVNLAPADLRKAGPAYDLPIAAAVLLSSGQVPAISDSWVFLGELSLDGGVRHTNGMLPMVVVAREQGFETVFVPYDDASEAAIVEGIDVVPVASLAGLVAHLRGSELIGPVSQDDSRFQSTAETDREAARFVASGGVDLADIRGQEHAKRALEVAAAGGQAAERRFWRAPSPPCCLS